MATRPKASLRRGIPAEPRATVERLPRRNGTNLAELAYDRLEELIITCALRPGQLLSIQDLQERTGLGRTPIHQAVSRLAADTLVIIRPRHGLQIAPVDLTRGRTLTQLRRDMERFVVRLATERCGASHRNEMLHIAGLLRERGATMPIDEFNRLDRRIDRLLIAASGEPFLENTLRPLHSTFRRTGWIYHSWVRPEEGLGRTIECHLAILEAVASRRVREAVAAADQLVSFSDSMFDMLGRGTDPTLFDCNLEILSAG
jgi:DNA-binding GntR family transcriptional regulator